MSEHVSVQICTRDRFSELALCLESLLRQKYTLWSLVVVDGSMPNPINVHKPTMDILTRIKMEGHEVTYVRDDLNLGVCQARNIALNSDPFKSELIVRIDEDSICEPDYLERLVKAMEAHPEAGAISGIVPLYNTEKIYRQVPKILNKVELDDEGNIISLGDDCWACYDYDGLIPAHHLRSSFILRRSAFDKIKEKFGNWGYDTDLGQVGFREEFSLGLKMLACGYKLFVDPKAICNHLPAQSGGTRRPDYANQVATAEAHMKRKVKWWIKAGLLDKNIFKETINEMHTHAQ